MTGAEKSRSSEGTGLGVEAVEVELLHRLAAS
jgi:hypothetical protein